MIQIDAAAAQPAREKPSSLDHCRRCELWRMATQPVPGDGPAHAPMMIIGEQPGDQEDLAGRAFVGPAGQVLHDALAQAGIERSNVYVTNAVKHFKWEPRGKRRLHKTPQQREIDACRYWLEDELQRIAPVVVVTLGATALNGLLGHRVKMSDHLGRPFEVDGRRIVATYHPSYALRQPSDEARAATIATIVAALREARDHALAAKNAFK